MYNLSKITEFEFKEHELIKDNDKNNDFEKRLLQHHIYHETNIFNFKLKIIVNQQQFLN